jgi:hypothetical protein
VKRPGFLLAAKENGRRTWGCGRPLRSRDGLEFAVHAHDSAAQEPAVFFVHQHVEGIRMHEAARSIMGRLRARDVAELAELGIDPESAAAAFASPAALARTFLDADVPAAIVAFHRLTPKAVVASLMATEAWPRVARAVVRWGVREARPALLAQGYARAECRTMEGHADAVRLLERLGFICECRVPNFGASGAAFLQYAWRLDDHVPVQSAESPAAAATPADARVEAGGRTE